jgi:hypothetical protein
VRDQPSVACIKYEREAWARASHGKSKIALYIFRSDISGLHAFDALK